MASLEWLQEMLPGPLRSLPTHMDFSGQQKAERIFQVIVSLFAIVGLAYGYLEQRLSYTIYCTLAGFFLSCLVILPPWPMFRVRKDLKWQKVLEEKKADGDDKSTESTKTKKKN